MRLRELPLAGPTFTWFIFHNYLFTSKLDTLLVSLEWDGAFPVSKCEILTWSTSDPTPIFLNGKQLLTLPRLFKFENMWVMHSGFEGMIRDWWDTGTSFRLLADLGNTEDGN